MTTSSDIDNQTPSGREQVTDALLAATEKLCAKGQPSSFSIKEIAAEASVTTSLLYFYFASKDDIVLATVRAIASEIDAQVAESDSASDIASAVSRALVERPAFPRLLAWFVLEGRGFGELSDDPVLARLVSAFGGDSADAITDAGVAVTLLLGNALFVDAVNEGLQRSRGDTRLRQALDHVRDMSTSDGASGQRPRGRKAD